MSEDPMDVLVRMLRRARALEERLLSMAGMLGWLSMESSRLSEDVEATVRDGVVEPLFTVEDRGDHYLVVVDIAGAGDDVRVNVTPRSVEVEASIRREYVEPTLQGMAWGAAGRVYRARIALPEPVDPSTARYEVRRGLLLLWVRKLAGSRG